MARMTSTTGDRYDLVVLGGGPAGEKAAAQAAYWGKRVAVVDHAPRLGGAMAGGVVSSKTMREAALYLTGFRGRDVYEVSIDLTPEVATEHLRRRTDDVVRTMTDSAAENMRRHGVDLIHGHAALGPDRSVVVQPERRRRTAHDHRARDHHYHGLEAVSPAGHSVRRPRRS